MLLGPTDAIYDNAKAHGVTVRAYGERGANTITPSNATWTDIYNDWKNGTRTSTSTRGRSSDGLRDIYHPKYPAATEVVPDVYRADIFLKEFAEFEKNGNLPQLSILLLYADHTAGTAPGFPTPRATVADNDVALGKIVEAISKSRYWKDSAIFVTEDDSQNGLDHVDGHRTVGMVISPYIRRGGRQHLLHHRQHVPHHGADSGVAAAEPVRSGRRADVQRLHVEARPHALQALPNRIPLDEMNPALAGLSGLQLELAKFSLTIDTSQPDSAPADTLNRAIWHSVKGFTRRTTTAGRSSVSTCPSNRSCD